VGDVGSCGGLFGDEGLDVVCAPLVGHGFGACCLVWVLCCC
jgi:hypothetical protein